MNYPTTQECFQMNRITKTAFLIASKAHSKQRRYCGKNYFFHPYRVFKHVFVMRKHTTEAIFKSHGLEKEERRNNHFFYSFNEDFYVVALLHDVIEDTPVRLHHLKKLGFTKDVIDAIDAISRRQNEDYFDYVERCCQNHIARLIKFADVCDNMTTATPSMVERYKKTLEIIKKHEKSSESGEVYVRDEDVPLRLWKCLDCGVNR